MVTIAVRWNPLGAGLVVWSPAQLERARLQASLIDMDD